LGGVFGRFSARGVQKHHKHIFTRGPCRKKTKYFDKNFDVSSSSAFLFFCFIAFSGVFQRWEFKSTTKNVLQKKSCRKVFNTKFDQKPKIQNRLFSNFFLSRSWAFLDEGSKKTRQKNIEKINLTLVLFRTLTHPPTTVVPVFFILPAPCILHTSLPVTSSRQPAAGLGLSCA
jgi:hypothetical protein